MATSQNGSLPPKGLPILSGPPPVVETNGCRQCGKEFNPLWRRAHVCGHCGYQYCSTCISDGQALMPRKAGSANSANNGGGGIFAELKEGFDELRSELGMGNQAANGRTNGYEVEQVCMPCLSMLQVTAAPPQTLRSLPLKRLKEYLAAYDIPLVGPKEKEDFVQAVLKARNSATGCLSPEAESYYRRKSVPRLGNPTPSARPPPSTSAPRTRPPPAPAPASSARPAPPPARPPPPQSQYRPSPQPQYRPQYHPYPAPQAPRPSPPRPAAAPASHPTPPPRPPSPPVPSILSLVSLPKSYLSSLSIGTLKAILYENHVRVDFKQVLEKEELINRVNELITEERKRLERQRVAEELEAQEGAAAAATAAKLTPPAEAADEGGQPRKSTENRVPTGPNPDMDRGLCIVCQDEEATLAAVDCGHLAMCTHCADLVMATSKECPLCRTRIVTPQRLIRIYRV